MNSGTSLILAIIAIVAVYLLLRSKGLVNQLTGGVQGGTIMSGPNKGQQLTPFFNKQSI